ncbi:hypothetical protein EUX98_g7366 [Antrodiella citrinella]|uniref:Arrestin-like N-terminal domain-containing protein n=1 Tax=Antrodiella citrinella TaxID=2447956 RepID=A0A4S4MNM0_9APHY|nr:hypothetical protein EUX98_g7366 [Antrodiella citrinella]
MRHPFASVQYFRNSLSTGTLNWTPGKTELREREKEPEEIPPVPAVPASLHRYNSVTVAIPPPSDDSHTTTSIPRRPLPKIPIRIPTPQTVSTSRASSIRVVKAGGGKADGKSAPVPSAVASPGHHVKHSSKVTLVLGGQEDYEGQLSYSSGSVIEGILAVPRPSGLLSIEIKIEGRVKRREVGGASFNAKIIDEVVYSWELQQNLPFPSKVSFRYALPTQCTNVHTGEKLRLPPSYEAHFQGIPGFHVSVSYAVTVYLKHTRDMSEWWRSGSRIGVPFLYRELDRPERRGPFPSNMLKTPTHPKTLFKAPLRSRWRSQQDLEIHVFLPGSRVCTIKEPIDFFVTVFGDDESLAPFVSYQPIASSFHPMSDSEVHLLSPVIPTSLSGLQAQFRSRPSNPLPPVHVRLQRRTTVDATPGSENKLTATKALALGTIHTVFKGSKSVTWSGTIDMSSQVRCGGFSASGLDVADSIVLTITQPDSPRSRYMPFSEAIPIRLTTETHDCHSAHPVSDWES